MNLKIKVTKDCIMNGKKVNGNSCPIKLAVSDLFPKAFVDQEGIYMYGLTKKYHKRILVEKPLPIPANVKRFINRFDLIKTNINYIRPFEFEIEIPEEIINSINIDELRPLLINHKNLEIIETV